MIAITFETFITLFLSSGLLFFVIIWIYYDRRDRLFYDQQRLRHIHHCVKCGNLYTSRDRGRSINCPVCGHPNASLRF